MHRVLLFGASGWLGSAVAPFLAARCDLRAPSHADAEVGDAASVAAAVTAFRPDVVVNLAAVNPHAGGSGAMERINASGAGQVAAAARAAGARLVHMSSDAVLDGRLPPYRDDAPACPVNEYGRTKAAGERAVLAAHPEALVIRTSLVFDPDVPDRFTRSSMERLARGEPVDLYLDEIRCPVARGTLAAVLAELVERLEREELTGRLNVAGTQPLSRLDFGLRLLRRFGAAGLEFVRPVRSADAGEPRPLDLTLDVSRAQSLLATPLRSVDEELSGCRDRNRGAGHATC